MAVRSSSFRIPHSYLSSSHIPKSSALRILGSSSLIVLSNSVRKMCFIFFWCYSAIFLLLSTSFIVPPHFAIRIPQVSKFFCIFFPSFFCKFSELIILPHSSFPRDRNFISAQHWSQILSIACYKLKKPAFCTNKSNETFIHASTSQFPFLCSK